MIISVCFSFKSCCSCRCCLSLSRVSYHRVDRWVYLRTDLDLKQRFIVPFVAVSYRVNDVLPVELCDVLGYVDVVLVAFAAPNTPCFSTGTDVRFYTFSSDQQTIPAAYLFVHFHSGDAFFLFFGDPMLRFLNGYSRHHAR